MARLIDLIAGHDARHRIILGSAAGAVVFFFLRHSPLSTDIIAAWDTFAFCVLVAAWLTILITPQRMRRLAFLQCMLVFGFNTIILALLINTVFDLVKEFRSVGK